MFHVTGQSYPVQYSEELAEEPYTGISYKFNNKAISWQITQFTHNMNIDRVSSSEQHTARASCKDIVSQEQNFIDQSKMRRMNRRENAADKCNTGPTLPGEPGGPWPPIFSKSF